MLSTNPKYPSLRKLVYFIVLYVIVVIGFINLNYLKYAELKLRPLILLNQTPAKRVAIVLFGVPKKFDLVWHAYCKRIIYMNQRPMDIFMHVYIDIETVSTPRNGEYNASVTKLDEVLEIFNRTGTNVKFIKSSQKEFDESLSWIYDTEDYYKNNYTSMKNVFRQANSLLLAYESANERKYDTFLFLRSDTFLCEEIDLSVPPRGIITPGWHKWRGVNDRIALADAREAKIYASRGEAYKHYLLSGIVNNTESLLEKWLKDMGSRVIEDEDFGFCIRLRGNIKLSKDRSRVINLHDNDVNCIFRLKPQKSPCKARKSGIDAYNELLKLMSDQYDIYYSRSS